MSDVVDSLLSRLTLDEQISFMRTPDMKGSCDNLQEARRIGQGPDLRTMDIDGQEFPTGIALMSMFAPGSWVMVGDNIPATVRQICISESGYVEYQCVWWEGRERNEVWLSAYEVKPHPDTKDIEVGFHTAKA